jgi:hypothetical protein
MPSYLENSSLCVVGTMLSPTSSVSSPWETRAYALWAQCCHPCHPHHLLAAGGWHVVVGREVDHGVPRCHIPHWRWVVSVPSQCARWPTTACPTGRPVRWWTPPMWTPWLESCRCCATYLPWTTGGHPWPRAVWRWWQTSRQPCYPNPGQ